MACLQQLTIRHLRNLQAVTLTLDTGVNVLFGRNGSGKTSVLEAVYLLGTAKSFRARHQHQVIQHGEPGLKIQGTIGRPGQSAVTVSLAHAKGRTTLQADGYTLARASELAHYLPVLLINTDSHNIVAGGPVQRRRVLDWGVFHVEHGYGASLSRYHHGLKQRNSALQAGRSSGMPDHVWDKELAQLATAVHEARERYMTLWQPWISHYLDGFLGGLPISIEYQRGWPAGEAYGDTLERARGEDRQVGYTRYGPHRANLHMSVNGAPAERCVSRGQQKLLVMALAFAQAAVLNEQRGDHCLMLVDDLAAELDARHRALAMRLLKDLGGQSILAVTEPELVRVEELPRPKMFHVEHGTVREVL